ncbi:MAG: Coenzyme F420 hydrogenase/dehydrogenase, beta subunit C-terminal domain [Prevotella sp.]|nr:Coenzyme F420 hydrogenase/dehydrogenase, beta subunit C-terminal domain [Prevotella sp.]
MANKNIQEISDNYLCSACGACYAICNHDAILFKWSSIGRKFAQVDNDKCVECGLCKKVCPSIDSLSLHERFPNIYVGNILNTYSGRATDDLIFRNAQSGGVCTSIIKYLFDTKRIDYAIMCKMTAGISPDVSAVVINSPADLYSCQKSCYTFVDVLSVLKKTEDKESIAIVGIPCHIEGASLLSEQFKKFSNIKYKIGLICDRIECKGMQDALVSLARGKKKILQWRKKDFCHKNIYYTYKNAPCVILDENEKIRGVFPNQFRFALKDMFTSPRCRLCYDKLNIHADIVLGDPWGMTNIDWQHGESLVITRTQTGESLIRDLLRDNYVRLHKRIDYSEVLKGQHIYQKTQEREEYMAVYNSVIGYDKSFLAINTNKIASTNKMKEFSDFIEREKRTESENKKEAQCIIKAIESKEQPVKVFLRRIKWFVKNHIKSYIQR